MSIVSITPYQFNDNKIRITVDDNGEPLFNGPDVCRALGLTNPSMVYERLDDDEKIPLSSAESTPKQNGQTTVWITESGLYSVILISRKPEAKAFKHWITHDVLPAIRKSGSYTVQSMSPAEIILMQAQKLVDVEREQARQAENIKRIEARQDVQDQTRHYFTIYEYANYIGRHIDDTIASKLGKQASNYCRLQKIYMGTRLVAGHKVNTYSQDILKWIFDEWLAQLPLIDE